MPFYVLDKNGIVAITDGRSKMPLGSSTWTASELLCLKENHGVLLSLVFFLILFYGREQKKIVIVLLTSISLLWLRNILSEPVAMWLQNILLQVLFPSASVIRELDCMKRHENFRRPSSKASSTLQWIEECMENTSLWLYVQSSLETKPVAPTPPITPTLQFIDGNNELGAKILAPCLSQDMEISWILKLGKMDNLSFFLAARLSKSKPWNRGNARFRISSQMPFSFTASSDVQFESFIISIISSLPTSLSL
uniref:PIN domain-containing protein n=1 Tax=Ananas comosus var. bracteatus TaxID=296719 RepID=A0A6V7Q2F4_ANACO|nr:unnamed protein product [Ananas comosus var. bracteatus]